MKNKILILLLIIVILICLNLYLNKRENFQATAQAIKSKEDISRMFNELEETDIFSGNHMNDKYFFDFLNWFHDNPNQLIEVFYRSKLEVITKT